MNLKKWLPRGIIHGTQKSFKKGATHEGSHKTEEKSNSRFEGACGRQWIVEQLYRIYEDGKQGFDVMMKKLGRMMAETIMYIDREELAVPSTLYDVKGLLKSAIRDDNPVVFLEQAANFAIKGQVPEEEYLVPFRFVQALEGRNSLTCAGREVTGTKTGTEVINAL